MMKKMRVSDWCSKKWVSVMPERPDLSNNTGEILPRSCLAIEVQQDFNEVVKTPCSAIINIEIWAF